MVPGVRRISGAAGGAIAWARRTNQAPPPVVNKEVQSTRSATPACGVTAAFYCATIVAAVTSRPVRAAYNDSQ